MVHSWSPARFLNSELAAQSHCDTPWQDRNEDGHVAAVGVISRSRAHSPSRQNVALPVRMIPHARHPDIGRNREQSVYGRMVLAVFENVRRYQRCRVRRLTAREALVRITEPHAGIVFRGGALAPENLLSHLGAGCANELGIDALPHREADARVRSFP